MKKSDSLQQYRALRSSLLNERDAIQKRLQELSAALGDTPAPVIAPPVAKKLGRPPSPIKTATNAMPLREAVLKVLSATPITRQELLAAVGRGGPSATPVLSCFVDALGKHDEALLTELEALVRARRAERGSKLS